MGSTDKQQVSLWRQQIPADSESHYYHLTAVVKQDRALQLAQDEPAAANSFHPGLRLLISVLVPVVSALISLFFGGTSDENQQSIRLR